MTMPARHLTLDITDPDDPVTGTLTDEDGRGIPFSGWMSLAIALEHVLRRDYDASPQSATNS